MDEPLITDTERRNLQGMLAMGCERETAAKTLGWSRERLEEVLKSDAELAGDMLQAEGKAELYYMRNLHLAAQDEKHWRASTWWFDHKTKKEDSRTSLLRKFASLLESFIERLIRIVQVEVKQNDDRQRLLDRFRELSREVMPTDEPPASQSEEVAEELESLSRFPKTEASDSLPGRDRVRPSQREGID